MSPWYTSRNSALLLYGVLPQQLLGRGLVRLLYLQKHFHPKFRNRSQKKTRVEPVRARQT